MKMLMSTELSMSDFWLNWTSLARRSNAENVRASNWLAIFTYG